MIRCREIGIADLDSVADLLTRGFVWRSRDWWIAGLRRQSVREVPDGFPRFGYMLDHEGTPVGVLLLIYTARDDGGGTSIRCNLSSWYVEPAFRSYAPMLTKVAQRHKHVTYVNISPAHWTWRTIESPGVPRLLRRLVLLPSGAVAPGEGHARRSRPAGQAGGRRLVRSQRRAACAPRGLRLPQPGVPRGRPRVSLRFAADAHPPDRAAGVAEALSLTYRKASDHVPKA
jgi:hypothetical protein